MSESQVMYGVFRNGIPYARWGTGSKTLVIFSGGPGNTIEKGAGFRMINTCYDPFLREYTAWLVTRKLNQPNGYSTRDMSDDYAVMIRENFHGQADLIIASSYGGLIAQHFAAEHSDCFKHMVLAISSHRGTQRGMEIDLAYARYLSEGKWSKALSTISEALYPKGLFLAVVKALSFILGGIFLKGSKPVYPNDPLVEAQAELEHHADESLRRISVPVLIIGGTDDGYFEKSSFEEMAAMIPQAELHLYEGKTHMSTLEDERFHRDVMAFIQKYPA